MKAAMQVNVTKLQTFLFSRLILMCFMMVFQLHVSYSIK